jgi:peptide/nickel transport system ATP-binding protein
METVDLVKHFYKEKHRRLVRACDGVSFAMEEGRTLGLVGESGCGKTTIGRLLLRLVDPDSGDVRYRGRSLLRLHDREIRPLRKHFQMIYQDSRAAFNPRMRMYDSLREAIKLHRKLADAEMKEEIELLIVKVNLSRGLLHHYLGNLSGGELKRLDIARALAIEPELLVADEPLALLDMSMQAQMVNLFLQTQGERNTALLFISHDLRIVRMLSHTVAVMYEGRIVERAPKEAIALNPLHPYTRYLWKPKSVEFVFKYPEGGCVYKNACALFQEKGFPAQCVEGAPELLDYGGGHCAACHFAG